MKISGLEFSTEGTGGGCTAAVAYVEGGAIVVTDGNVTAPTAADEPNPYADYGLLYTAGFYAGDAWTNGEGEDSTANGEGLTAAGAVEALMRELRN